MKTIAKAALGTIALALLATAGTPAIAARVMVATASPAMREPPPCLRAPEYRPAFCFRRDMNWRAAYWRHLSRAQQMAFVQHRYWGINR